jgi:hypothetical protein
MQQTVGVVFDVLGFDQKHVLVHVTVYQIFEIDVQYETVE